MGNGIALILFVAIALLCWGMVQLYSRVRTLEEHYFDKLFDQLPNAEKDISWVYDDHAKKGTKIK